MLHMSDDDVDMTTYLTLGSGDFTFELDFARFLLSSPSPPPATPNAHYLIATGYDTLEELVQKYRDTPFVLRQLRNLSSSSDTAAAAVLLPACEVDSTNGSNITDSQCNEQLRVTIRHGVNAIAPVSRTARNGDIGDGDDTTTILPRSGADVVIFNFPHLGTEDAQLHSRFMCHLFCSVRNHWLSNNNEKKKGVRRGFPLFHLTLADGQYERWRCSEAAKRHAMKLVHRCVFIPPAILPLSRTTTAATSSTSAKELRQTNYYTHRRNYTGKSFRSRTAGDSETFTFVREEDLSENVEEGANAYHHSLKPIWIPETSSSRQKELLEHQPSFACPYCERMFREERSVKAHVEAKHVIEHEQQSNKRKHSPPSYVCPHCKGPDNAQETQESNAPRTFSSRQALEDHVRAKHTGAHTYIRPDWCATPAVNEGGVTSSAFSTALGAKSGNNNNDTQTQPQQYDGTTEVCNGILICDICGLAFGSHQEARDHDKLFEPRSVAAASNTPISLFQCRTCKKSFRERRAQLQHENTCASRDETSNWLK